MLLLLSTALAADPIVWADIHGEDYEPRESTDPAIRVLSWPFCPATPTGCGPGSYLWVELGVSIDAYVARRNHGHDSIRNIVDTTSEDLLPLVDALNDWFERNNITSDAEKVATSQGLLQAVSYGYDKDTGWTEYPKFGLEYLVDEQGDCDDAAIANGVVLSELGYEVWFVKWRNPANPTEGGHMSTAITRTGDLVNWAPPAGSVLVKGPEGALLHADATGTIGGCTNRCTDLGWNQWTSDKNLVETEVVRVDAHDLDERLGLMAWDNDGHFFPDRPDRDRRGEDLDELDEGDWEERTRRRLKKMGEEDPDAVVRVLKRVQVEAVPDRVLYGLSGAIGLGLLGFIGLSWSVRTRRKARAEQLKRARERQRF